ncbi:MAG TPA: dual specificity protein phosphatase family protein [Blastocatellia bacterium]|nr:dual specificity protein phosphatase family protein [Blastocatellia bacterium]
MIKNDKAMPCGSGIGVRSFRLITRQIRGQLIGLIAPILAGSLILISPGSAVSLANPKHNDHKDHKRDDKEDSEKGVSGDKSGDKSGVETSAEIENFGRVTDFFYRGAQPKGGNYGRLASIGIKTVIDLRDDPKDFAKESAERAGLKYINFPMDDKAYPASDTASRFLSIVNDQENWPVYVHCAGGRHRTGAMTAVFRMTNQGWDIARAYDEMKKYDFYTRWGHKVIKQYVYDYYRQLTQQRLAGDPGATN